MENLTIDTIYSRLLAELKSEGSVDSVSKEFSRLTSDEMRANAVLNLSCIDKIMHIPETPVLKSSGTSVEFRTMGNQFFQQKNFASAIEMYTKSIAFAPLALCGAQTSDISLGMANRSAALYHLKYYKLCIIDIDRALGRGYPNHLHHKAYERRGKCLLQLRDCIGAKKSFQNAFDSILHAKGNGKAKTQLENTIQQLITSCDFEHNNEHTDNHDTNKDSNGKLLPCLSEGKHNVYQSLTSACDVTYTQTQGRYIMAKRDINPGEVILVEKPYASVVLKEQVLTHCDYCYEYTIAPIPCVQCPNAMFCSETCHENAWKGYHAIECKILAIIHESGVGKFGHLALRTITKSSLQNLLKFRQTIKTGKFRDQPKELYGCSEAGKYLENDYNAIYHLVTHDNERAVHDLFRRAITAVFIVKCLMHAGFFTKLDNAFEISPRECQGFIAGLILSHLQLMPCNAHEINELELDPKDVAQSPLKELGAGIYSTLSLFNHSCDPTANRNFYGDVCIVRAIKFIPKGQEVSDNYGAVYAVQPLEERINKLTPQYFFTCQCDACVNNWPLLPNIESNKVTWKCQKCGEPLSQAMENHSECQKCKSKDNVKELQKMLEKSQAIYKTAFDKLLACDVDEAEPNLCSHLKTLQKIVVLPWFEYNCCQEALKQCFSMKANCVRSLHVEG